jgi:hypothetical protein
MPAHHRRSRAHRGPASVGPRGNSRPYRDMQFAAVHESAIVKVFGCRPRRTMPQALAAGVRKPPRDETAIWALLKAEWDAAAPLRDALTIRRERWRPLRSEKGKNGQRPNE